MLIVRANRNLQGKGQDDAKSVCRSAGSLDDCGGGLVIAAVGSLGVAAIGLLLSHWFDLSQWQGTLIALAMTFGLGYLVYKLAA